MQGIHVISLRINGPGVPSECCTWPAIRSHSVAGVFMCRGDARVVGVNGLCWAVQNLVSAVCVVAVVCLCLSMNTCLLLC